MEIFIENNKVKFTQGVQTFSLSYEGNKKELKWMAEQLDAAFKNLMHEVEIKAYKQGVSDLLSNSDGLDMNYQAEKLIAKATTGKFEQHLTDIEFVKWYSGMEETKILSAYKRYLVERK